MTVVNNDPSFAALSQLGSDIDHSVQRDTAKLLAFYLPQYHRVKENSEWWGPGFTEWTNVARGKPNFDGHYQPHIPRDLGFYDLYHPEVMYEQAEMAKLYGLYGFCFYHYWFSGRRILERPLENFLKADININFCLCWANENWTRTWDGDTKSVLLAQNYSEDDDDNFIESLLPYFNDKRYIRVDGKPLLVVYRAKDIPSPAKSFAKWRQLAKDHGFTGLHIAVVDFYDITTATEVDADALVEFPPHKFNGPGSTPDAFPNFTNPDFAGSIVDYSKVIAQSIQREKPDFKLYRGIIPSWDNTARRQNTPTTIVNANPEAYGEWLRYLRAYTRKNSVSNEDNFIFINAWNEWGEGCHLEPDQKWGLQYLEQTLKSSYYNDTESDLDKVREDRIARIADVQVRLQAVAPLDVQVASATIVQQLTHYQPHPHSAAAHLAAQRLNQWPFLYKIARLGYRAIRRIRG
ncbi:glycosyltransferase WbsX family protein [Pseudomonas nicosulfuronedens]